MLVAMPQTFAFYELLHLSLANSEFPLASCHSCSIGRTSTVFAKCVPAAAVESQVVSFQAQMGVYACHDLIEWLPFWLSAADQDTPSQGLH